MTKKLDRSEFEVPETVFVRDVENRVFQAIVWHTVSQIQGVVLAEGNFLDALLGLGRDGLDRLKAIHIDQDAKNHTVAVRVEVNIAYGLPIPDKAEEIQNLISREIPKYTGLHVARVHVVFKGILLTADKPALKAALAQIGHADPRLIAKSDS
jgi:uncharacterized alkaline shock family protein YloU